MNYKELLDKFDKSKVNSCFIIAEAGINHNGDINIAKKMIDVAKDCGVDAIKFQTFKADEFISDKDEQFNYYSQGKEKSEPMFDMFKRHEFSKNEWIEVFDYCKIKGIIGFSTPQNKKDLDFLLEFYDMPIIKIGSDDLTNLELIKYYASFNKPTIISAGMAFASEIEDAVRIFNEHRNYNLVVLHCVSSYPTLAHEVNLNKMKSIESTFGVLTGFSDHTNGIYAAIAAVSLGARVVEKHFTLDNEMEGPDHWFSANPDELKELVKGIRFVEESLGVSILMPTERELEMRKIARRSIVASSDISSGTVIISSHLTYKRPGVGLAPKSSKFIIGRKCNCDIKKDEIINLDMFSEK